jgi:hypothetical protein
MLIPLWLHSYIGKTKRKYLMGKMSDVAKKESKEGHSIFMDGLYEGCTGPVIVMLCRRWDVININNKYMSTDYIVSDKKVSLHACF